MISNDPVKASPGGGSESFLNSKRIKKAKGFFKYFIVADEFVKFLNKNTLFVGMMMFLMNIASRFVTIKVSKSMEGYLKYTFSKHILIFTIAFIGTRDLYAALVVTLLFAIFMDFLFNEDSQFCCLPHSFTSHHISLVDNSGNPIDNSSVINPKESSISDAPGLGNSVNDLGIMNNNNNNHNDNNMNNMNTLIQSGFQNNQNSSFQEDPLLGNMSEEERIHVHKYLRQLRTGTSFSTAYR